jgi:hypothetical protein
MIGCNRNATTNTSLEQRFAKDRLRPMRRLISLLTSKLKPKMQFMTKPRTIWTDGGSFKCAMYCVHCLSSHVHVHSSLRILLIQIYEVFISSFVFCF